MASSNRLIVEVVGDTTKLSRDLNQAQKQIDNFARKSARVEKVRSDLGLNQISNDMDALAKRSAEVDTQADKVNQRLVKTAAAATVAGIAVNRLGANFQSAGGNLGKFGNALSDLSTGNIVGFVKGIQSINSAATDATALKKLTVELTNIGDASKATELANKASAAGFDKLAEAAAAAAVSIRATTDAFVDATKIRDSTSPGVIAAETSAIASLDPKKRKGITAEQRNQFFDSAIAREVHRVQDIRNIRAQVTALHQIGAEIEKRIAATKDITRKLTLEDELAQVNRQARGLEDQIAADAAARAKAIRLAAQRDANALTNAAKTIKKGVAAFAAALKEESGKGGPLTKTTALSTRILDGLDLGRDERILRARLSHFNSAGLALVGSGSGSSTTQTVNVVVDGKVVAKASSKYNKRTGKLNQPPRNGPNAGGWTGRG